MWDEIRFDEELPSWEDYLWYLLLRDKYPFQYCPKAAVYHSHPFSIKAISRRAYRDGKALKIIKKKYNIDLIGEVTPLFRSKIEIVFNDFKNHASLFVREGYMRHLLLMPLVRLAAYRAYWRGYRSVK
jgi:hypothetical protein